jgi:predicted RNase H-like nuclease
VQSLLAGIDGCSGGWVAALADDDFTTFALRQITSVEELFVDAQAPSILAVDMPIGLPDRTGPKGRTPERLVRSFLGGRQSSVFSIPSRSAVYAGVDPNEPDERKRYLRACDIARATSAECKAVSKQGFHIFPKIVEIDLLLQRRRDLVPRAFEVHPEVAFYQMNGSKPLSEPKKVKGRLWEAGVKQRSALLTSAGIPSPIIEKPLPRPVGRDDWIDALAALVVARRRRKGEAVSFPSPPERDALEMPIAIWA